MQPLRDVPDRSRAGAFMRLLKNLKIKHDDDMFLLPSGDTVEMHFSDDRSTIHFNVLAPSKPFKGPKNPVRNQWSGLDKVEDNIKLAGIPHVADTADNGSWALYISENVTGAKSINFRFSPINRNFLRIEVLR